MDKGQQDRIIGSRSCPLAKLSADEMLADDLAGFYADPLGYVMYAFPWSTDASIKIVELKEPYRSRFNCKYGPDLWACKFLDQWGEEIKKRGFDGRAPVMPIKFSTASGHGIGKSTLCAWIVKFILDTRPLSKGMMTAVTSNQLQTKTWAEVGKWHKMSVTEHLFDYSASRGAMMLSRKGAKGDWNCQALTCKEENAEAFQGLHAANSTAFYIFDEASGIDEKIFSAREGGATDGEPMWFDFGNPTRKSGSFFDNCVGRKKDRFIVRAIDSREVAITNKELIQQWVEDEGEESDYIKVKVRGVFPSAGSIQFIPSHQVEEAMKRVLAPDRHAPLVIGVDVARFGDDETVIYPRIGMDARSFPPKRFKGLDTVQVVGKIIETIREFRELGMAVSGLFVDGGGIGGGVVDQLRHLNYAPIEVQFGGGATDKMTYRFKSDEMWGLMREAIKNRLVLPDIKTPTGLVLHTQLTQREFGYTQLGNKVHLESKDKMKERLGGEFASPDVADALACTFAQEVGAATPGNLSLANQVISEYNPFNTKW